MEAESEEAAALVGRLRLPGRGGGSGHLNLKSLPAVFTVTMAHTKHISFIDFQ